MVRSKDVPVKNGLKLIIKRQHNKEQAIAEIAYYKSEKRGFTPGHEWEDWFEAEKELRKQAGMYGGSPRDG